MKIRDLVKGHVKYGCRDYLYVSLYDDFDQLIDRLTAEEAVERHGDLDVVKWFEKAELCGTTIHIVVGSVEGVGTE